MKTLNKERRNCLFSDETTDMKIHKQYTYLNCMFECSLFYTQMEIFKKYNILCQPWFFPTANDSTTICDPWQSYDFFQIMSKEIPDNFCRQCLPECGSTVYKTKMIVEPFDLCDKNNLGTSQFCRYEMKKRTTMQEFFLNQIQNEFFNETSGFIENLPDYIPDYISFNCSSPENIFKKSQKTYNPFEKDIAMVQIIYHKSTLLHIGSQVSISSIFYEQLFST